MAHITAFDYHPGNSFLHLLDNRFKLVMLLGVNLAVARSNPGGLLGLTVILIPIIIKLHISFKSVLKEIRFFLLLLLFVFTARSFTTPGVSLFSIGSLSITEQGVLAGGLVCWRLFLIVVLGLLFIRTSRAMEIKAAIQWYLKPVPWISGQRIALMISLMFRFIPMILELSTEIAEAQQSRAVGRRKNPLFRIRIFVLPLMEGIFKKADEMVDAMEARCFSENRTDPLLSCQHSDWRVLALAGGCCLWMLFV
ncbi:energy-coupling factor transporter transmembrane protein EcfT [bacterium]|nr:energy-coupling factor transporter transmembrane protein EcfT [bacterium]